MTAPAPSPEPARRSRRLYVYWGAALAVLTVIGIFCWFLVYPVLLIRGVINDPQASRMVSKIEQQNFWAGTASKLGTPEQAAWRLNLYRRMPMPIAEYKWRVPFILRGCGKNGVKPLIGCLRDADDSVRGNAGVALGRLGTDAREAVPALIEALSDTDWANREAYAWALGEIGGTDGIGPLENALKDSESRVREAAAEALEKIRGREEK